eukprot:4004019-Alexandrium_andersonii.AAC.1
MWLEPTTPTGGADNSGSSRTSWPPHLGWLRTTRHTVGSCQRSGAWDITQLSRAAPQRAQPLADGAACAARPPRPPRSDRAATAAELTLDHRCLTQNMPLPHPACPEAQ